MNKYISEKVLKYECFFNFLCMKLIASCISVFISLEILNKGHVIIPIHSTPNPATPTLTQSYHPNTYISFSFAYTGTYNAMIQMLK